ncbi:transglutaminaseTgpA domain-containing protein [Natronorubrum sp. FCH18a]|uniref:transglutaminase TgpA family protein n=1 Tax=Natronorubrum sp. FCH18a TaxID=3447018 RepID=UPI003F512186
MSTKSGSHTGDRTADLDLDGSIGPDTFRLVALCCVLVLTASYVSVLREVTRVVGGTQSLFALVGAMVVVATVLAWTIRPRTAVVAAVVAGAVGFAYYLEISGVGVVFSASDAIIADTVELAAGLPLLRMVEAGVWTLAFVPTPVFLSWYLAVRGRYALAVIPGGFALAFLVLTGDAGTTVTLLGTLAAIGAVGFGELERRGGSIAQADLLAVSFALIIVLSLSVTFVPEGSSSPAHLSGGDPNTLEGAIDYSSERSGIGGSVDLSPEVRFTVESERGAYWRTGVYDRFTGDEWVRTGDTSAYNRPLADPPGEYERVQQVVTAETDLGVMPAAGQPIAIEGDLAQHTEVSAHGQFHPTTPVIEGDSYAVESAIVDPGASELRAAGTNYPRPIVEGDYLQTPESTSSEFEERTAEITADADTPYDKAVAIEGHLRSTKGYSLEVDRPDGNVAEEFLLEMDEGYCVYFATAMTQMLRAEDVPARYVTGYTSGQQVDDDEYVVRGTDAHAWVEVYFPDHGWVAFEPTPPGPRDAAHAESVEQARSDGLENVDTDSSQDVPISDEESSDESPDDPDTDEGESNDGDSDRDETDTETNGSNGTDTEPGENESGSNGTDTDSSDDDEAGSSESDGSRWSTVVSALSVSRETAAIGLIALVGLVAGARRTAASSRARRTIGRYWQRRSDDPDRDAERAYRRLERVLAREYRPRERSESARSYLEALSSDPERDVDPQVATVVERYERVRYGGGVNRAEADEAVEIVDDLARTSLPVVGGR